MSARALRDFAGRHLTLSTVWVVIVLAGLFAFIEQLQIRPNDFWSHLRLGELIVETRARRISVGYVTSGGATRRSSTSSTRPRSSTT
jgi:hypothetical protein